MACTCGESYTVTDTWESEYYIIPKVENDSLKEVPGCECGSTAPGPGGSTVQCVGPSSGTFSGGQLSQDPAQGEKVMVSEPKKTDSKNKPEPKCEGDCSCSPGTVSVVSDNKETTEKKTVSIDVEVKDVLLNCKCSMSSDPNAGPNNDYNWQIKCQNYKIKVDVEVDVYKRKVVQEYTMSCSCKS